MPLLSPGVQYLLRNATKKRQTKRPMRTFNTKGHKVRIPVYRISVHRTKQTKWLEFE